MKDKLYLIFLLVIFSSTVLLIRPIGNFPLADDWTHSLSIRELGTNFRIYYPRWLSSSNYISILLGASVTHIIGFSFTYLRIANLLISCLTTVTFYLLLRFNKLPPLLSFLGSLLLFFNPIFLNLSFTSMADILSLLLFFLSLIYFPRDFLQPNPPILKASLFWALLFFLNRQIGLIFIIASLLSLLLVPKFRRWKLVTPYLFLLLTIVIITKLLHFTGLVPESSLDVTDQAILSLGGLFDKVVLVSWTNLFHLSLSILPLTLSSFLNNTTLITTRAFRLTFAISFLTSLSFFSMGIIFPVGGNIINYFGLGPSVIHIIPGNIIPWGSQNLYLLLHFITPVFLALLVSLFTSIRSSYSKFLVPNLHHWLFMIVYFFCLFIVRSQDRYLLFLIPGLITFCLQIIKTGSWSKPVFTFLLIILGLYSTIGTHNYLSWNRARWKLGERLIRNGVPIGQIGGGYEWDGWFNYTNNSPNFSTQPSNSPVKLWYSSVVFPNHQPSIFLSLSPLEGFISIDQEQAQTWFQPITIYALKAI